MPRLLKLFIFVFSFSFLVFRFPSPTYSQSNACSLAPQPNSPEIVNLINKTQACGGAAKYVPLKVLQAIYWIEGTVAYANPSAFICKKNSATALGLMQVTDGPYHSLTPSAEQLSDDQQQCTATGKFSRCYPNDAMEIAARVLLDKIFLWDKNGFKATGNLASKNDVYYASGRYYGSFQHDALTNKLASYLSPGFLYPSNHSNFGTLTYAEFVCALSGFCNSYQDYPLRSDKPHSGTATNPPYSFSSDCLHSISAVPSLSPSIVNSLRPNPFELVKEEKDRPISDPNLSPFCAFRPTVVQTTAAAISGTLSVDFRSLITPFLSAPGNTAAEKRYLADYLESSVFNKLASQSYQDQLKNAMIARASGRANPDTINQAYGFPTATTQVHDYEINTPSGKFKLSKLTPKPLGDPDALAVWLNSPSAQAWPYVPMFTREDSKGFIQSLPEPGQTSSPQIIEVIHPHLARTYEVSSTIANLLSPESTHQFQPPDLPISWIQPAPWTTDNNWLDSSQSVPAVFGPVCDPQEPTKLIAGPGEPARGGQITTAVSKSSATANPLISTRFSPVYLKTYTPFLDQIAFNLLTGPGALFGIFNPANEKPANWPAVGNDSQKAPAYSFTGGRAESGLKKPGQPAQYLYNYLGTLHCQKEKLIATLQPFLTGQNYNIDPECSLKYSVRPTSNTPNTPNPAACTANKTPLPFPNTASASIAKRAWEIVSDLYQGFWCYWNRSPEYPELFDEALYAQIPNPTDEQLKQQYFNMFWCTWLVVKSFSDSGNPIPIELWTPTMANSFKSRGKYLDASNTTYQNISPGDAIFFRIPANNSRVSHVGIVYTVNIDGISSVESNAGYKTMLYPTDANGYFQTIGTGDSSIKVEGFGKP